MSLEKEKMELNKKYIEAYKIDDIIESIMTNILRDKPDKPLIYILKMVNNKIRSLGINVPAEINDSNEKILSSTDDKSATKGVVDESSEKSGDTEFNLVTEVEQDTQETTETETKNENGKKGLEAMLEAEKVQERKKDEEIQEKLAEKESKNAEVETALEAEDDSDMKENEFPVEGSGDKKLEPSIGNEVAKVIVKKEIVTEIVHDKHNINFNICSNCSKVFQKEGIVNQSGPPSVSRSVIMDDLESASQVEGPRPISIASGNGQRVDKKLISVSDIESSSKAWPVKDTVSETSTVKSRGRGAKNEFLKQV